MSNLFSKGWKLGQEPPAWLMKEFKKALTLMGRNRESLHTFEVGLHNEWTFVIGFGPNQAGQQISDLIARAVGGQVIDPEHYYPGAPRTAVHGDLYA